MDDNPYLQDETLQDLVCVFTQEDPHPWLERLKSDPSLILADIDMLAAIYVLAGGQPLPETGPSQLFEAFKELVERNDRGPCA